MSMPFEVFDPEQLTINDVPMRCAAWMVLDLENLWIPTISFDNRVAPGVAGSVPFDGSFEEIRTSLPFWITGYCDPDGVPYDDVRVGFRRNWRILATEVFDAGIGTATYQSADAEEDELPFRIQVPTPTISERYPSDWKGSLAVILPDGPLIGADPGGGV